MSERANSGDAVAGEHLGEVGHRGIGREWCSYLSDARIALLTPALQKAGAALISDFGDASKLDNSRKQLEAMMKLVAGFKPNAEDRSRLGLPDPDKITATRDALVRATDAVEKYILQTNAQAGSVGLSIGAQEKAKVVADLTAAALRDGKTNLDRYAASWDALGTRAGAAAQALAQAQVNAQIKFQHDTALLSPQDVQIAQQLKGVYDDVATSLNGVEAAAMRMNGSLKPKNDNQPPAKQPAAKPVKVAA